MALLLTVFENDLLKAALSVIHVYTSWKFVAMGQRVDILPNTQVDTRSYLSSPYLKRIEIKFFKRVYIEYVLNVNIAYNHYRYSLFADLPFSALLLFSSLESDEEFKPCFLLIVAKLFLKLLTE